MNELKSESNLREQLPWENYHETIFADWGDKAACYNWLHNKSYLNYTFKRNLFTIPVIIMSTLTGTANFALDKIPEEYVGIFTICVGSINILAGIITTISQFLKLNELTESHRVASVSWDKFSRSIRLELIKAPHERTDVAYFMKTCRDEFDRLKETSPGIDKKTLKTFVKNLTSGKDTKETERKIKIFSKISKPEIFNELYTIKDVIYKAPPSLTINIDEIDKFKKLQFDRENYNSNVLRVNTFILEFKTKYSRHPSQDELFSNLKDMNVSDLKHILNDLNFTEN